MDFFKILKGGVGLGMSNFDRLFAEKHGGGAWQLTTLTGTLPLTFQSKGSPLTDYKLYGTSEGAGAETESGEPTGYKLPMTVTSEEETENLFSGKGKTGNIGAPSIKQFIESNMQVSPGETYCINASSALYSRLGFYMSDTRKSASNWASTQSSITVPDDCDNAYVEVCNHDYIAVTDEQLATATEIMLTKGSTPPDHYIPYRYSTTTPIYIGDSKLGEEEYVDYESGKVWKLRDNLFDAEQIVEDSVSTASTYIKDGWLRYNTGPSPITINADGQVGETFQFKLWAKNFNTTSQNNIRFILEYEDGTTVITGSNSFAAGTERYVQFTSNSAKALKRVISQNTSNRSAGIEISKTLIVKSDTMPETYLQPTDPPVALPEISTYEGENVISFDDGVVRTADSNPEHPQLQADLSLPIKQSNVLYFFREFANVTDSTASQREVYVITKSILPKLDYINIHFWENGNIVKTIKTTSWYTGQNIAGMRPMFPPEGYCFIIVTLNKVPINRFPFKSTIEMVYRVH